jgi:transposase
VDTDSVGLTACGEEPGMGAQQYRRKFTPEFRDEAVRLVIDSGRPIAEVARDIGVNEGTLGNWVNLWRSEHAGEEAPLGISERAELAQLRRDNQALRMEREFLKKAAAFFATEQTR